MCDHARLIRIYRLAVNKTAHKIMSLFFNKRVQGLIFPIYDEDSLSLIVFKP